MARLQGAFHVTSTALTGGTAQTVLQINAPTNQRLAILEIEISFDGTNSANTPVEVRLERQTGGTFTNTAVAPVKVNDPTGTGEALQANSHTAVTVEPTEGDILEIFTVTPFGGTFVKPYPPGQEILVMGGTNLGVKLNAPQSVNARVNVKYEE